MSDKKMTPMDVASRVEWEGGLYSALVYGIKADDIEPGPLADAWREMEKAHLLFLAAAEPVERLLPELDEDHDEDGPY